MRQGICRPGWWIGFAAFGLVIIMVVAGACSADEDDTTGSSVPGTPCAWAVRADKETLNIAYPDTAATYWALGYDLAPGELIELRGRFPQARYASFISYGPNGGAIDVLTDRDIVADPASSNPFAVGTTGTGRGRNYTVTIRRDSGDGAGTNVVRARTDPSTSPTTATAPPTTVAPTASADPMEINRLGGGGVDAVRGTVLYRVYLPDQTGDPTGGAGLPKVAVVTRDSRHRAVPTCASPGASSGAVERVRRNGPATDKPAPSQPTFIRPEAGAATLYPNPDNIYIATILEHQPGRIAVVEGKAPTSPDPAGGHPVGRDEQVRYWSLCTNEYRKPYPVTACATDQQTALDSAGRYTYVISTPEDRPTNATAADGVTWLDWGSTKVNVLVLLRHMLASPSFPESAVDVAPGALAVTTMADYAPRGVYCDKAAFERGDDSCKPS